MPSHRIRAAALAAAALAVPAVLALTAAPAAAHNELRSSNPADGAALTALPPAVVLTFAENADPRFVRIAATGPDRRSLAAGAPVVTGAVVRQPLAAGTASGTYTVAFRVVSRDGHPVQGSVTFTATLPATGGGPSGAAPSPSTAPSDLDPRTAAVANVSNGRGGGWLVYALAGAGLLALVGVVALVVRSGRRGASPAGH